MTDPPVVGRRYRITRRHYLVKFAETFDARITYSAFSSLGDAWCITYTRPDGSIGAAWLHDDGDTVVEEANEPR